MYQAQEVVASAARTTNGNSGPQRLGEAGYVRGGDPSSLSLLVRTTAIVGTPSLTLSVEWSHDGANFATPETADQFTAITAANISRVKVFEAKGPYYRIVWVITGGTPSITFSVNEWVKD